jgi:hypothetical protein
MTQSNENGEYSKAFDKHVKHPDDLVGLLAYVIYKAEKRARIIEGKENGSPLTDEQISQFEVWLCSSEQVQQRRMQALTRLNTFVSTELKKILPNYEQAWHATFIAELESQIKALKEQLKEPSPGRKSIAWLFSIFQNVLANFVFVVLILMVVAIAHIYKKPLYTQWLKEVFGF